MPFGAGCWVHSGLFRFTWVQKYSFRCIYANWRWCHL